MFAAAFALSMLVAFRNYVAHRKRRLLSEVVIHFDLFSLLLRQINSSLTLLLGSVLSISVGYKCSAWLLVARDSVALLIMMATDKSLHAVR